MKVRFAVSPHAGSLTPARLLEFADAIESAGFDGVWLSDLPLAPVLDPLLALALLAGRTRRLRLGANVVPLGRNPFLLAKELAQLDQLSGGRLLLSFVTGIGGAAERHALGLDGVARGAVLEEALGVIRAWWSGQRVTLQSRHWSFTDLPSPGRPVQDPLEVWLGGRGPQALERVGRIADGWLGAQLSTAETRAARERIQAAAARAEREIDPEHFGLSIAYARSGPDPDLLRGIRARRDDIDPAVLVPVGRDGLRSFLDNCVRAGLSKFVLRPLAPVRAWEQEAAWLADAILDLQT